MVQQAILDLEYREQFHLSAEQFDREPWEAMYLWKLKWIHSHLRENDIAEAASTGDGVDDWGFAPVEGAV